LLNPQVTLHSCPDGHSIPTTIENSSTVFRDLPMLGP